MTARRASTCDAFETRCASKTATTCPQTISATCMYQTRTPGTPVQGVASGTHSLPNGSALAAHARPVGAKAYAAVVGVGVQPAGRTADALLLGAPIAAARPSWAAHVELDGRKARQRARDHGEDLAAREPDLGPEGCHRHQL